MGSIYTNLDPGWLVPGIYINVDLGRAAPSAAAIPRRVLIIGSKAAGVSVPDNDLLQVSSPTNAGALFGYGAELHLMAQAAFKANPAVELWAYVQPQANGSTAATTDIEVTHAAEKDGTLTLTILGQSCRVRITAGDLGVDVAAKVVAAVAGQLKELPYKAQPGSHFKFLAKAAGSIWNGPTIALDPGDTGLTFNPSAPTLSGGSGEENLAANAFSSTSPLQTKRFHYVVIPTILKPSVTALADFVNNQAKPEVSFRQQGLFATRDTLAGVMTTYKQPVGAEIREPRVQCIWAKSNGYFPCQLAAAVAATRCQWEGSDPAVNLCLKPVPYVPLTADADLLTTTQKNTALANGITPLVPQDGRMAILRSVTMADIYATNPVLDTGKVTVSDYLADDIQLKMRNRYKGFKLSPDTEIPLPSKTTTPSGIKTSLLEWLRQGEAAGYITRVTELKEQIKVEIDPDVDGRVNFEIPEDVVDIFAVGAGNIIQIG